jgi:predicted flavoprotein YhiN
MSISPFITATPLGAAAAYRTRVESSQAKALELSTLTTEESTQQTASASSVAASEKTLENSTVKSDPAQELQDYMKMSYAEKLQWSWMHAHGISKEDFEAMSPEDKQKLLDQMREELKQKASSAEVDRSQNPPIDVYV